MVIAYYVDRRGRAVEKSDCNINERVEAWQSTLFVEPIFSESAKPAGFIG